MKKILLSAFACDPFRGSEPGCGWNWALGLAQRGFEVHCLTRRVHKKSIEKYPRPHNLHFHYFSLPLGLEFLYSFSQSTMYLYYLLWQWLAYKKAKKFHIKTQFDIAHHVTWGSLQMGSFLYKLDIPFIFGPAGGGQETPIAFKKYFRNKWKSELKRNKIGRLFLKMNPGFKNMVKRSHAILVSNDETLQLAKNAGASNCFFSLDVAIPENFFPKQFFPKYPKSKELKLLWVGRFMPRKGVLLLIDVMKELKEYQGITLTLVGDGEMRKIIKEAIVKENLGNKITLIGNVPYEQVRNFYFTHDVFLFASLRDSGGVQLIEAMSFGLPVVTLNLHGQALIINDQTGIRCNCETPAIAIEELKKSIIHLYNNPEKVNEMSDAAFTFAKNHSWVQKINTIVNQYYPIS